MGQELIDELEARAEALQIVRCNSAQHTEVSVNEDLYSAPQSELQKDKIIEVPEEIRKKIKNAWVAGLISIGVTVTLTLISMSGTDILGLDAAAFFDVFLMVIFTFGIYKNSRICAVLMLLHFCANKVLLWPEAGAVSGLPLTLVFVWFYTMGVVGTFQYHRFMKQVNA